MNIQAFQEIIWNYASHNTRDMPWRQNTDPYYILVSELMLQQTQVDRVIPKFEAFIARFPTISQLAEAPLSEVLVLWNGLGYNRRAKFLWQSAQKVQEDFGGKIPETQAELVTLPGVGPNTAGALLAYAFNQPVVFVETNIRTVYFHHFFSNNLSVADKELIEKVASTIDHEHPREWYWALMDYGTHLKKQGKGAIQKSVHYKKQSQLKGSHREMRGWIIKDLSKQHLSKLELELRYADDPRYVTARDALLSEGMMVLRKNDYYLA